MDPPLDRLARAFVDGPSKLYFSRPCIGYPPPRPPAPQFLWQTGEVSRFHRSAWATSPCRARGGSGWPSCHHHNVRHHMTPRAARSIPNRGRCFGPSLPGPRSHLRIRAGCGTTHLGKVPRICAGGRSNAGEGYVGPVGCLHRLGCVLPCSETSSYRLPWPAELYVLRRAHTPARVRFAVVDPVPLKGRMVPGLYRLQHDRAPQRKALKLITRRADRCARLCSWGSRSQCRPPASE